MFAFGVFDREGYTNDDAQIPVQAHAKEAQRIEEGGITLLRNRHAVLPLRPAKVKKIALIGSDAEKFKSGGGSSNVTPLATVNARQGIEGRAGSQMQVTYDNTDDPEHSAQTAKDADVAVVVVSDTATEGEDAPCIAIDCTDDKVVVGLTTMDGKKRNLDEVITAVAKANKRTVVVMETSGPVLTPWRGLVAGIVEAWYPGEYGGAAIARVLFGDVDPGGRLPATFPQREADLPTAGDPLSYPGVNNTVVYKEGVFVGYRWFDARHLKPAYPFGFGMSYTRFRYSGLRIKGNKVSAVVRNVGRRTGSDVVQLYIHMPHPSKDVRQPPRQLKGFRKLTLRRGQAKRVVFTLKSRSFSYWDVSRHDWTIAPGCYRIYVGRSSRDLKLGGKRALAGGSCRR
jgi:beta-glucosidase